MFQLLKRLPIMGLLAVANRGGARMLSLSFTSLSRASSSLRSGTRICSTSSEKNNSSERQTTSTQEQLPRPDLRKLAELAKVSLTDEQIKDFQPKVDRVVDWYVCRKHPLLCFNSRPQETNIPYPSSLSLSLSLSIYVHNLHAPDSKVCPASGSRPW